MVAKVSAWQELEVRGSSRSRGLFVDDVVDCGAVPSLPVGSNECGSGRARLDVGLQEAVRGQSRR